MTVKYQPLMTQFYHLMKMLIICLALIGNSVQLLADTPQTHDVPLFHNDDGLGLHQDCGFMLAIAQERMIEIPSTVNARSTNCLASIKTVVQIIHHMQHSHSIPMICIPSIEPDWLDVLQYVTAYMENQHQDTLANESYGVWIMEALRHKYPCI